MPGRHWYWIAAAILVASAAAATWFILSRLGGLEGELARVVVPGQTEIPLAEPGRYTIFHEPESVVDGRYYAAPTISGLEVRVESTATGATIPLAVPPASTSYEIGGHSGVSIFVFDLEEPGWHRILAGYADGRGEPRTVLAIGLGFVGKLFAMILGGAAIGLGGFAVAVVLASVVLLKRRRAIRAAQV